MVEEKKKNWFLRHKVWTVIIVLVVLGAIGSAAGGSKTGSVQTTSTTQTASNTEKEPVREPEKVSARELADDFDANQVAAESKWKDKYVEFSAEITNITDSGLSFSKVASKEFSFAQISCRIKDKQQLLPLKNGQTVTVRGIVGTQTIGVIEVRDCEVVQ